MPNPHERASEKKFTRTPGGRVSIHFFKGKAAKHSCALCGNQLHGTPHGRRKSGVSKLSKSERRPSSAFGGVLCGGCREIIFTEAIKVKGKMKDIRDVSMKSKKYVEMAMARVK